MRLVKRNRGLDVKKAGQSPQECIALAGRDGFAHIVAFWMFSHVQGRTFYGTVTTAVRQLWGADATIDKSTLRYARKALSANGYSYVQGPEGFPRYAVPEVWAWEPLKEIDDEQTEGGEVTTSYRCDKCGERFEGFQALGAHSRNVHGARAPGELKRLALNAIKQADRPLSAQDIVDRLGGDVKREAVSRSLRRPVKDRTVIKRIVPGTERGKTVGYVVEYELRSRRRPHSVNLEVEPEVEPEIEPEPEVEVELTKGKVILRPDGTMLRVVREYPDGTLELEVL